MMASDDAHAPAHASASTAAAAAASASASSIDDHYPQTCPFCNIAAAYPHPAQDRDSSNSNSSARPSSNPNLSHGSAAAPSPQRPLAATLPPPALQACVPASVDVDPARVAPECHLVLSAERTLAFLDIMPMTRGHLLVTTRAHRGKLADVGGAEGGDVGFWLPLLAKTVTKVTGTTDYNIVQNNGARAAQVVPHVHFHIIPRPASLPQLANKSWTMFGRGQREGLDDDDAAALAAEMRRVLREEIEALSKDVRGKL